jgi:hypothetical protein
MAVRLSKCRGWYASVLILQFNSFDAANAARKNAAKEAGEECPAAGAAKGEVEVSADNPGTAQVMAARVSLDIIVLEVLRKRLWAVAADIAPKVEFPLLLRKNVVVFVPVLPAFGLVAQSPPTPLDLRFLH